MNHNTIKCSLQYCWKIKTMLLSQIYQLQI